jgi:hypothetical protein
MKLIQRIILAISTVVGKTAFRATPAKCRMFTVLRVRVRDTFRKLLFKIEPRVPEHPYNFGTIRVWVRLNILAGLDRLCNCRDLHSTHALRYTAPNARSDRQIGARLASLCSLVKKTHGHIPGYSEITDISTGSRITAVHHAISCSLRSFTSISVTPPLRVIYTLFSDYLYFIPFVTVGGTT